MTCGVLSFLNVQNKIIQKCLATPGQKLRRICWFLCGSIWVLLCLSIPQGLQVNPPHPLLITALPRSKWQRVWMSIGWGQTGNCDVHGPWAFFSHKIEWSYVFCSKIDATRVRRDKWNRSESERQILHAFFHLWLLDRS